MNTKVTYNKKLLRNGLFLLVYTLICPLFLTENTLGIYSTFRQALRGNNISLLYISVLKLILLNCLRSIPNYLGAFLISESISIQEDGPHRSRFSKLFSLFPLLLIPIIYYVIYPIYGIRYDFGTPAVLLVLYVLILSHINLFAVSLPQKIITLVTPFLGMQFLDVVPHLTPYGFGRGEISYDIKIGAAVLGCEAELSVFALSLFSALILCSIIHLQLLIREHRIRVTTEQNQKIQEELYQARLEALRLRSASEAQSLVHDLKTPLTTIKGLTGLAEMMEENPLIVDYLSRISHASENMAVMISDILHEDSLTPVRVDDFLHAVLSNVSAFLPPELISVNNSCSDSAMIQINRIRMIRAISNLLENAWKVVDPHTGHILLCIQEDGDYVQICVEDNGIGMSREQLDHAFDIGWSNTGSTGLGLGYVKRVVDYQGGTLHIESIPGKGTKVFICLKEVSQHVG